MTARRPRAAGWPGLPVAIAAGLAILLALAPRPAAAHANLLSTSPRPGETLRTAPGVVVLTFSEKLDVQLSRATVTAPGGQRFDQGAVSEAEIRVPLTTNAPGVYQVGWTSVSAVDGHTLSGGFRFGVGVSPNGAAEDAPLPGASDLALAALRGVEYAGLLLVVGLLLIVQLAALSPRLTWVRDWLPGALAVTAGSGLTVVLGEALVATGALVPDRIAAYLTAGTAGWTRIGRVAAEGAALLVVRQWRLPAARPVVVPLVAVLVGAALVMLAAAGHAAAVRPWPVGVAVTVVHLVAAGLWAGGIFALAVQRVPEGWRSREGRRLLARFSPVALTAFAVTAVTGVLQAVQELSGVRDLLASAYGQVLSVKSLAVLLMVPLSVLAWRRLLPTPRAEAVLALVAVGASALLAAFPLPPARLLEAEAARAGPQAALALPSGEDLTMAASAGDTLVGLTLRPGRPGPNTAWLYLLPLGGEQAASTLRVTLAAEGRALPVRRCGPSCRAADVELRGGESVTVGVGRGATAAFRVPALPAADGRALVDRMQQLMHALRTFRLDETLRPARVPLQVTYAFQAPDRMQYRVSGGAETVIVGGREWTRAGPASQWQSDAMPPVEVPTFIWDGSPVIGARVLSEAGQPPVVAFFENQEGVPVWFQLSLDARGLVEAADMRAQAHFMTHRYHDFDAPLTVEPPVPG